MPVVSRLLPLALLLASASVFTACDSGDDDGGGSGVSYSGTYSGTASYDGTAYTVTVPMRQTSAGSAVTVATVEITGARLQGGALNLTFSGTGSVVTTSRQSSFQVTSASPSATMSGAGLFSADRSTWTGVINVSGTSSPVAFQSITLTRR